MRQDSPNSILDQLRRLFKLPKLSILPAPRPIQMTDEGVPARRPPSRFRFKLSWLHPRNLLIPILLPFRLIRRLMLPKPNRSWIFGWVRYLGYLHPKRVFRGVAYVVKLPLRIRVPKTFVLKARPNDIVPTPKVVTRRQVFKSVFRVVGYTGLFAAFLTVQYRLGTMAANRPTNLLVGLLMILTGAVVMVTARDIRWRFYAITAGVLTLSGTNLAFYFAGQGATSTFALEFLLSNAFMAWLTLDLLIKRYKPFPPIGMIFIHLLWWSSYALSTYFQEASIDKNTLLQNILKPLFALTLFLATYVYFDRWQRARWLLAILLTGVCVYGVLAIIEYFFKYSYFDVYGLLLPLNPEVISQSVVYNRVVGPFNSGPAYGVWLVPFLPIALYTVMFAKTQTRRSWTLIVFFLPAFALFLTASRGPALAATISLLILITLLGNGRLALTIAVSMAIALGTLIKLGPYIAQALPEYNMMSRVLGQTEDTKDAAATLEVRQKVWVQALDRWQEAKMWGIGPGVWQKERDAKIVKTKVATHSAYINIIVEHGAYGVFCIAVFILTMINLGLKAVKATPSGERRGLAAAAFAGCCGTFLCGFTEPAFLINRNQFMVSLLMGLMMKAPVIARQELEAETKSQRASAVSRVRALSGSEAQRVVG